MPFLFGKKQTSPFMKRQPTQGLAQIFESGANLKFIQSILGHADVSTTMNIYVDVTDALKKKEITAFDDYMTTKLET